MLKLFRIKFFRVIAPLWLCTLVFQFICEVKAEEKGVVCVYYKHVDVNDPSAGYYVQIINKKATASKFIIRFGKEEAKAAYVDIGREIAPNERDVVERNLATRVSDMFSVKNDKLLKSPKQYRELFTMLFDGNRVYKQVDLSKNFDIKDTVYAFDFDAAAQNYSIFKNDSRPEALALYQFVDQRWTGLSYYPNYKDRVSKHDFREFLSTDILDAIFNTKKSTSEQTSLTEGQKKLIIDADQKATWSILLAVIGLIAAIFSIITGLSQTKDRNEQTKRIEGKVKTLENRLNKPFYQLDQNRDEEMRQSSQIVQALLARVISLEKASGVKVVENGTEIKSFRNETAKQLQQAIQHHKQQWSENPLLASDFSRLALNLDEFQLRLNELEAGLNMSDFIGKYAMPHIDSLDTNFQPEPDAPISTPEPVEAYIKELCRILAISEIEVRVKISRFDNERHEKAGAILRTSFEPGTITKVLRRGLIHNDFVRKALVIRAE